MRVGWSPRRLVLIVICAMTAGTSGASGADDSLKDTLQARYAAMKAAMAAHDATAITAILAPGFTSIDVLGQSEAAPQMIAEVNGLKPDPNKVSTTTLMSVSPAASAVTVEQRYDMKTIKAGADGVAHNVELVTLSTDTWVRPANVWLIGRTVTDELSYFVDGQLVGHKVKP